MIWARTHFVIHDPRSIFVPVRSEMAASSVWLAFAAAAVRSGGLTWGVCGESSFQSRTLSAQPTLSTQAEDSISGPYAPPDHTRQVREVVAPHEAAYRVERRPDLVERHPLKHCAVAHDGHPM